MGLQRWFGYRRLYVAAILERAPRRATLAVAGEIARLAFALFGCALVSIVLWLLTAGAAERAGGLGPWPVVFGACALASSGFGLMAAVGIVHAVRDLPHVRAAVASKRASA